MSAGRGGTVLYTPDILALAVSLADYPLHDDLPLKGDATSRVCGSRVAMGALLNEDATIARIGARVSACAIGQAAAAVFLRGAPGRDADAIADDLHALEAWLGGESAQPDWAGVALLEPARQYPARHGAILLPWKAALAALSMSRPAD